MIKIQKSLWQDDTERRLFELENHNEYLLKTVAELQEQNAGLFKMHVHFMSMMASELNKGNYILN